MSFNDSPEKYDFEFKNAPPEKYDFDEIKNFEEETDKFLEYKKSIESKYGNKYDDYLLIVGFGIFMQMNSIAFNQLSPEEKIAYLNKTPKNMSNLKCPHCGSSVVDKRFNKQNKKSPDFMCTNNNPSSCSGHDGTYKKAWWMNSKDLPKEWIENQSSRDPEPRKTKKPKKDLYSVGVVDEDGFFDQEAYDRLKSISPCSICGYIGCKDKNNCY